MKRISLFVDAAAPVRGADGSSAHPFPTLEAARDALRRRSASGAIPRDAPVTIARFLNSLTAASATL